MAIYKQFDIVVVPFPFTDRTASKRRPALVLSDESKFNQVIGHSLLCMITTAFHSKWPLDTPIQDLASTGLKSPSIIRMKLFTLDNALILRRIGQLGSSDCNALEKVLKQLLSLV